MIAGRPSLSDDVKDYRFQDGEKLKKIKRNLYCEHFNVFSVKTSTVFRAEKFIRCRPSQLKSLVHCRVKRTFLFSRILLMTILASLPLGNVWKQNKLATTSNHSRLQQLKVMFALKHEKLFHFYVAKTFSSSRLPLHHQNLFNIHKTEAAHCK